MVTSIIICALSLIATVLLVRHRSPSLGLPVAYVFQLLLLHLPGAVVHAVPWARLPYTDYTETGIRLTAIGVACFVIGIWLTRRGGVARAPMALWPGTKFLVFCVLCGWIVTFGLYPFLVRIPTVGSLVDNGCKVWMIGIMLALPVHLRRHQYGAVAFWLAAMLVFTLWKLVFGGFLAHSVRANLICLAPLVVLTRKSWRVWLSMAALIYFGMSLFVSYFLIRDDIRDKVWGGSALEQRWDESTRIVREFQWFDLRNPEHLEALDARLNQNYFVGLSAERLREGAVEFRKGETLVDGVLMLIPRAVWPDKPLTGGSPKIVAEMTGLPLDEGTSFGVGNVMEFHINFGIPSLVIGFLLIGVVLGKLDYLGAKAFQEGNYLRLIALLLPAIALIQPGNSFIEQVGGSAGALLAAWFWCSLWQFLEDKGRKVYSVREEKIPKPNLRPRP